MIDKEVFAQGMGQLGGAFGREIDGPVSKMYYNILSKQMSTSGFLLAVEAALATETFWPSPAVLLSKVMPVPERAAQHAFDMVNDALRAHGGYRFLPSEVSKAWPPETWAGIKAVGGLMEISNCTSDRWDSLQKRFRKAFVEAIAPAPQLPTGEKPDARAKALVRETGRALALPPGDR